MSYENPAARSNQVQWRQSKLSFLINFLFPTASVCRAATVPWTTASSFIHWKPGPVFKPFLLAVILATYGQISSFAATPPGTTYVYDAEGRVIQATISDGGQSKTIYYTYDAAGNLVSVTTD
jgi:hypothetical protein